MFSRAGNQRYQQSKRSRESGIALIIVMLVIVTLGIMAGGFAFSMRVETRLAGNGGMDSEFEWVGRSGMELAKYALSLQQEPFDALGQFWASGIWDPLGQEVPEISLTDNELGRGVFSVKIVDLERKFNINIADEIILNQSLALIGVEPGDVDVVRDSILDWIDPDDETHLSGYESSDYLSMVPPYYGRYPYFAKNGPLDDITELLKVYGVTPAMFWGNRIHEKRSAYVGSMANEGDEFLEEPPYLIGLADLFSTLSHSQMNLNTAPLEALLLNPYVDENMARDIISFRAGPDGVVGTEDDTPFQSVAEVSSIVGGNPQAANMMSRYFTTASVNFEVFVQVRIGQATRVFKGILRRNSPVDIQLIYFSWDQ